MLHAFAHPMELADEKAKTEAADAFEKLGVCRQLAVAAADLGWKSPTSIQEQAVPHLLAGRPPHLCAACQSVPVKQCTRATRATASELVEHTFIGKTAAQP